MTHTVSIETDDASGLITLDIWELSENDRTEVTACSVEIFDHLVEDPVDLPEELVELATQKCYDEESEWDWGDDSDYQYERLAEVRSEEDDFEWNE